jgi:hypothetical protein
VLQVCDLVELGAAGQLVIILAGELQESYKMLRGCN